MAEFADNPNPEDQEVPDEVAAMFDLKKKKKKKKKVDAETTDAAGDNEVAEGGNASADQATKGDSDLDPPRYTYTDLLNRVVDLLHANNPDLVEKRRYTMKPPQLMRGILDAVF
jgi:translation initiation factor 2 subunit 2